MILLLAVVVGALVAWSLGGRPSLLAQVRLRFVWLIFASLAVQVASFTPAARDLPASSIPRLHLASYALLILFTVVNARRSGFWLLGFGLFANALAIASNGGFMPVSLSAWVASGHPAAAIMGMGESDNNVLMGAHTHLAFLGDRFALPAAVPFATALSIGDLLIVVGMTAFLYRVCTPPLPRAAASTFAPLRSSAFRHVLAGRLASTLGDWLAMTAVVTWVFHSTHSTRAVSLFLVSRIIATVLGGAASAPLLNRLQRFRALAWIEGGRGALTALMIPAALGHGIAPVMALVCASSFLGAATSPSARSLIPDVLPEDQVHQGNALHGVARNLTMVVGAVTAALSVGRFGITAALVIDVVTFVIAALLYLRFRGLAYDAPHSSDVSRRELAASICRNPVLFGLVGSFTVVTAAIGIVNAGLPEFVQVQLGQPNSYGYALSAIGAGLLVGELMTGFIRREATTYRTIPIAFATTAAIVYLLSTTHLPDTGFLLLFLLGATDGTTEITYDTIVQRNTSASRRPGVFALASAIQNTGMIVGLAAAPLLASLPSGTPLRIAAATCLLSLPLTILTFARSGWRPHIVTGVVTPEATTDR